MWTIAAIVDKNSRLAFCPDTCHIFATWYSIKEEKKNKTEGELK
jgi:endonuclease IV